MTNLYNTNIVIPMAGQGSRFKKIGIETPKPLIPVFNNTMIEWALKSFNFLDKLPASQFIFIVLKEHIDLYQIDKVLKEIFKKNVIVISIDTVTNGQAETVLKAKKYINNLDRLFIYNCDTYSLSSIWELIQSEDPDGVIPCFESNNPRYSFVKVDNNNTALKVVEKQVVSNLATTGMYYFKQGKDFVESAEHMIKHGSTSDKEYFVAPCYNKMIKKGKMVKIIKAYQNWILGTPEELANFLNTYHE